MAGESVIADVAEEFKNAPPAGKALMVVAVIAVAGVALYAYKLKNASASTATTGTTTTGSSVGSSGTSGFATGSTSSTSPPTTSPPTTTGTGTSGSGPGTTIAPPKVPVSSSNGTYVTVTKFPSQLSTLWGISEQYYGNGALWHRIAQANNISDPTKLQVGQKLYVPK